jgi:hypothetical protein
MIEDTKIDEEIAGLTAELRSLVESHNKLLAEVAKNQTRHAQLTGALGALKKLKGTKYDNNNDVGSDTATQGNPDRVSYPDRHNRSHSGVNLGD